ncbi:MAG: hypothetical protein N2593_02220 [Patescibacteria group bacterium]|nr:hypothetical protein [Patescibacteria group bacterium]MCX7955903.1 hypothetical protein [Patescibacteria group bacterium]
MKLINIFFIFLILLFIFNYFFVNSIYSVCPVCTIAVGAGLELTRVLGVDDLISGIWIGGLIVSMSFWLSDWFSKKKILKPFLREILSLFIFYLLTIPFLLWNKMIGIKGNVFFGIDKIIFGIIIGSIVFFAGVLTDKYLRKINNDKVFFYYQKVIIPFLFLSIISLIFFRVL